MAIASLILAILGFLISVTFFKDLSLILCVISIVLGIIAIVKKKDKTIAIIAIVVAFLGFVLLFSEDNDVRVEERKLAESATEEKVETKDATKEKTDTVKAEYEVGEGSVTVSTNSIGTNWIKVAVPVKNTGTTNLYLSSCSIDIEDSNGALEDVITMVSVYPQVIQPGETAYYFEETTYDGKSMSGLKAIPHVEVEKAKVPCVRYVVSDVQLKDQDYFGAKAMGRVENTTEQDGSSVYVVMHLFNEDHNIVGVIYDIVDNGLKAGEKKAFQTMSLDTNLNSSEVSTYETFAYPYQYQF